MKNERTRLILFWVSFCCLFEAWKIDLALFKTKGALERMNTYCLILHYARPSHPRSSALVTRSQLKALVFISLCKMKVNELRRLKSWKWAKQAKPFSYRFTPVLLWSQVLEEEEEEE